MEDFDLDICKVAIIKQKKWHCIRMDKPLSCTKLGQLVDIRTIKRYKKYFERQVKEEEHKEKESILPCNK